MTLRLPETLNEKLPQTLEEGEEFGKNFQWFSLNPKLTRYNVSFVYFISMFDRSVNYLLLFFNQSDTND